MPIFQYKAINSQGIRIEDKIEAEDQIAAMNDIERKGYTLLEIKGVSKYALALSKKSVTKKELAAFCKQLSYLVGTGIALHRGIEIIGEQTKNSFFRTIIQKTIQDIKEGFPLSQAIAKHPKVFPESMVFQVKAAESGGFMQHALENIANNFERDADFSSKVKGAMMYPIIVLVVSLAIVYFMLTMVVPKMANTLSGFDAELPAITQFVMGVSNFAQSYWYVFLIGIGIFIYALYIVLQDEDKRFLVDTYLLKVPVIGKLLISIDVARMTRVMASLLSSGVPIDDTLDNLKKVIANRAMRKQINQVKEDVVEQGVPLSKSLELKEVFPRTMVQVVAVGEESGNLPDVLNNLAENLELEVSGLLKTATSLINPILMIFIGGIVGVIVLSLFTPMFSLMDSM